ncbi:11264_t:CDS:2, partial [Dentiscutata heterogama]
AKSFTTQLSYEILNKSPLNLKENRGNNSQHTTRSSISKPEPKYTLNSKILSEFEALSEPEVSLELEALLEPEISLESESLLESEFLLEPEFLLELTSRFKVISLKGNNCSDGLHTTQVFACNHFGMYKSRKDLNKKGRNKVSKKCNCLWSVCLNYNPEDDKYYISQVNLQHNHQLIPPQLMKILPGNRKIPIFINEKIFALKKTEISIPQIQSLLINEISSSFVWLFKSFICIFGTALYTILTDNNLTMSDTISSVLTNKHGTKYSLYIWHMLKNIRSNMISKLGKKYNIFYADLMKCLNHYIDQVEFKELWNCIMKNNNYAEAKSYLEALSWWCECLLKEFIDCKTRLTEFLAAFEHALDLCKEAEHISAYKELVYPILLTFPNPIKNQAASYLTCYLQLQAPEILVSHESSDENNS